MRKEYNIDKIIDDIKEILKKQGYDGKNITYEELKKLYDIYGKKMGEQNFAKKVLGLTDSNYSNVKYQNAKAKILKKKEIDVEFEQIKNIKEELIIHGYEEKSILYKELQELYKIYGQGIGEQKFAEKVLELTNSNYINMRNNKAQRGKILKKKVKFISPEEIENIKNELKKLGYEGKAITYFELQKLCRIYGMGMKEKKFAEKVLELNDIKYNYLISGKKTGRTCKILIENINEIQIEKIKCELINQGYEEKLITYKELQKLHKIYGQGMDEKNFTIRVLGLFSSTYSNMKNKNIRGKILKIEEIEIDLKEIEKIKKELIKKEYGEKLITYGELQELYKLYGMGMKEKNFAKNILGLSLSAYSNMKNKNKQGKILKSKEIETDLENIERIKKELIKQGYEGKLITYGELKKLYETYGQGMNEKYFAETILELKRTNYWNIKNKNVKGKILYYNDKINIIHNVFFNESRYYSKDEIKEICESNQISSDKLMLHIFKNMNFVKDYKNIMEEREIWIGKARLSNDFIEKNYYKMIKIAKTALVNLKNRYMNVNLIDKEDLEQEAVIYLIQNRGDIEKNFLNEQKINKYMYISMKRFMQYTLLRENKIKLKTVSLHEKYTLKDSEKELQDSIKSEYDTEQEVLKMLDNQDEYNLEEVCIKELRKQIENGATREQALSNTSKKLKLEKNEMLKKMQTYLINEKNIAIKIINKTKQDMER